MAALRIGLTGGIASGKSLVAHRLEELGALVIDADLLAREVVEPGTVGLDEVVARFGESVLLPDGSLDRAALGRLVFADDGARADLESIIHPRVRARAAELVAGAGTDRIVVQVIPLLVETGQQHSFDQVVVVDLPVELQLARLMERNGLDAKAAQARVAAQADRDQRLAEADRVIDNSADVASTLAQIDRLWEQWQQALAHRAG